MSPIRIDNWCTRPVDTNPYTPPERAGCRLSGIVYDHPKHPGERFHCDTSPVASIDPTDPRLVTTASGRVYRLGRPDQKWLAWLKREGKPYNPKQPIRVRA